MAEKKRAGPFTEEEKNVLLECMYNYKDVIENKKTDGTTVAKKIRAWEQICLAYNSHLNVNKVSMHLPLALSSIFCMLHQSLTTRNS